MRVALILFLLTFAKSESDEDRRFDEFHRAYERDSMLEEWRRSRLHDSTHKVNDENLERRLVQYTDGNDTLTGFVAYDKRYSSLRPAVLIVHDWNGRDEFENDKAIALAKLGYIGFALDLFGRTGNTPQENQELIKPFRENRQFLLRRLQSALDEVKKLLVVDQTKFGAIGYCFGGMGVLDMARAGWDLKGVVSFHGSLNPPPQQQDAPIKSKILVLHGHDDPGIPPSAVEALQQELTKRKADWQVHVYSNTVHAFTVPTANSTSAMYNPLSDKRSWLAMKNFFEEVFA